MVSEFVGVLDEFYVLYMRFDLFYMCLNVFVSVCIRVAWCMLRGGFVSFLRWGCLSFAVFWFVLSCCLAIVLNRSYCGWY